MDELKLGIICGSGMAGAFGEGQRHTVETPFGPPSDAILQVEFAGTPVYVLSRHGPGHTLNPTQVPYRANVFAMKKLGVTHVIATGAVGSLREEFRPRDLLVADQVIDRTVSRASTFFDHAAVHVDFAEPFCPALRKLLIEAGGSDLKSIRAADDTTYRVHDRGCYLAMEGPSFSTRAESLMHRLWGSDIVGMTAMPEARLAREAELPYALLALVTDFDSWRPKPAVAEGATPPAATDLVEEIIANLKAASDNATAVIRKAIDSLSAHREALVASPARNALKLGIWSDKTAIDRNEVDQLAVLWGRYFAPS